MNLIEVVQLLLAGTGVVLLGRVGFALTRWVERRLNHPGLAAEAEDRLRVLEEECSALRQEVTELQERQDFTERALLPAPASRAADHDDRQERGLTSQ
jgi:hypothetical protein